MTSGDQPAATKATALAAAAVTKDFPDGTRALDDVSFEVAAGETVALVGQSGSGKTTLLRLFNRMADPTSGTVRVGGRDVSQSDPVALRRGMGYVPQEGGLLPHWRTSRNVELVPRLLGWPRSRCRQRGEEMLRLVGLDPEVHGERYPIELSGGQRQRVALARALAADPPIVLLDEPFSALDALIRRELQEQFAALRRQIGKTMLLVTHDLLEAMTLADRVAVLRNGRLLQIGPAAELLARPADDYVRDLLALAAPPHPGAKP